MKKNNIIIIILFLYISFSCDNFYEKKYHIAKKEVKKLELLRKNDSLYIHGLENGMSEIYEILDSVSETESKFFNIKTLKKRDAVEIIKNIGKLLEIANEKSNNLSIALENINSIYNDSINFINKDFFSIKEKIAVNLNYYSHIEDTLNKLKKNIINWGNFVEIKDKELENKNDIIIFQYKKIKEQLTKLKDLQVKIKIADEEVKSKEISNNKKFSKIYYDMGIEIRKRSDNIIFKRKEKRILIKESYNFFQLSFKLGNEKAKKEIEYMKSQKKYKKYI